MPLYETKKDKRNQKGAFDELRNLLHIRHFEETPPLHVYDYKTWIGEKDDEKEACQKTFLEVKCYNTWHNDYGFLTLCAESKFLKAKGVPDDVQVLYATRYWNALFVWDLKTVVPVKRLPQPRRDRPEDDWVVQLKQTDAIHEWWTNLI